MNSSFRNLARAASSSGDDVGLKTGTCSVGSFLQSAENTIKAFASRSHTFEASRSA